MPSSSSTDVLDEATVTLITQVQQMKESKTPQQVEDYINKLQGLGRHLQLQEFRNWLNTKCNMPIQLRPRNMEPKEPMEAKQIEHWINEWAQKHAKGRKNNILKHFLRQEFKVAPYEKSRPCDGCQQNFMQFLLLPMRPHNMDSFDPDEHSLFCYSCCTEVSQMLSPGHWLLEHPAHIKQKNATRL